MSLKRMLKFNSLEKKIIFFILLLSAGIILLSSWLVKYESTSHLKQYAKEVAILINENTSKDIGLYLANSVSYTHFFSSAIKNKVVQSIELIPLMKEKIRADSNLFASALALEPNVIKGKKEFCKYIYRDRDAKIKEKWLHQPEYDYLNSQWYTEVKRTKKHFWSEPYYDKNGGNIYMTTYSYPIFNADNKFIGVVTADIALDKIQKIINKIKLPYNGKIIFACDNGFALSNFQDTSANQKKNSDKKYLTYETKILSENCSIEVMFEEEEILKFTNSLKTKVFIISVFGILMLIVVILFISKKLTGELNEVIRYSNEISKGNFDILMHDGSHDDIGNLINALKKMQKELKIYIQEIKQKSAKEEKVKNELILASKIQKSFLPDEKEFEKEWLFSLSGDMLPAKEVGGDFYGFRFIKNKLAFYIGDVSGKGIPASLFMMASHMIIENSLDEKLDPAYIIKKTNTKLTQLSKRGMFATMLVCVIDFDSKTLTFSSAGHFPPMIKGKNGIYSPMLEFLPPIAIFEDTEYKNYTLKLDNDSLLVVYTDGVSEAENIKKEQFGIDRLCYILQNSLNNSQTLKDDIVKSVKDFTKENEQNDDITLLAISTFLSQKG